MHQQGVLEHRVQERHPGPGEERSPLRADIHHETDRGCVRLEEVAGEPAYIGEGWLYR